MTPAFRRLVWTAAGLTYALIVLGAWVRISDSGMGCGDHWPLCNGKLFPPLDDPATLIEWTHRLIVSIVALPIGALAVWTWVLRRGEGRGERVAPGRATYLALGLVLLAAALGRATVILELPAWTTVLHFATAITLLATLLVATQAAGRGRPATPALVAGTLALATLLLGALTANSGAAAACGGFPLCNGQIIPSGGALQHIHWTHRLFAYGLVAYATAWAARSRSRETYLVLALVLVQGIVAALMVLNGLPRALQALHVAVGVALWGAVVVVALRPARLAGPAGRRDAKLGIFPSVTLEPLPGGDLIEAGLRDLERGIASIPALLVSIGAPRLERVGVSVPNPLPSPEHRLFALLEADDPETAHSRFNALVRRLVSFERAAECAR
jgi:heme A synthase